MKVLQVISSFPPAYSYGGPLKVAQKVSQALVERGHEVTVYTTDVYSPVARFSPESNPTLLMDGYRVYRFKNISNRLAYRNFPLAPQMAMVLRRTIDKFDVVHLHEYRSMAALLVWHYAKGNNVPYCLQAHGSFTNYGGQYINSLFDRMWQRRLVDTAAMIIALTSAEANQYYSAGVPGEKVEIIPNGIDISDYSSPPAHGSFRNKFGLGLNDQLILYVGRIHKKKGVDLLIKAYAEVSNQLNNTRLVIVGPSESSATLEMLKALGKRLGIEDKVLFTGLISESDKLAAYVDADVYVLPSFYDTFPMSVLDALACGTPVIITNRCELADAIGHAVSVVAPEVDEVRDAIIQVLTNEGLRIGMGQRGQKLVLESYRWDEIIKKLEQTYYSMIGNFSPA